MLAEEYIQRQYFTEISFSDDRERQVFLSYVRGFMPLIFDSSIKKILEIGGGQSTALFATLGQRIGWKTITIDMEPHSIARKIRQQTGTDKTIKNIQFQKGISINTAELQQFYCNSFSTIGGVDFKEVLSYSKYFIDTSMDSRKAPSVAKMLKLEKFDSQAVVDTISNSNKLSPELLSIFRTPGDEFESSLNKDNKVEGCLQEIMESNNIDVVFLDSGEFSSLPEWEIVRHKLRSGGYVILHDIFFPKSFKNWLVAGSIMANPDYQVYYIDRSTSQGLMIAQKK